MTRAQIMARAVAPPWEPYTVEYSMADNTDCSAYVSWCWGIPRQNTVTLVTAGWMAEIDPNDLLPGDAVGHCGEGTSGAAGHVQLFDDWLNTDPNDSRYWCWHQNGDGPGPRHDLIDFPSNYKAYRFKNADQDMGADDMPTAEQIAAAVWAHPIPVFKLDAAGVAQPNGELAAGLVVGLANAASWTAADALVPSTPDRVPAPGIRPINAVVVDPAAIAKAVNDDVARRMTPEQTHA